MHHMTCVDIYKLLALDGRKDGVTNVVKRYLDDLGLLHGLIYMN